MKIIFEKVSLKNFFSFGNNETIFDFKKGINIVTGSIPGTSSRNGIGKSTLLVDSLSFAIYGKPLKGNSITKEDIINKRNKKNCVVELYLKIGNNSYIIKRGIKPNFLILFENDVEIKFDSIKNTQKYIDDKIGISYTCFSNIISLNINTTLPFLMLDASQKREVIEDVLNLKVFSKLSDFIKEVNINAKNDVKIFENALKSNHQTLEVAQNTKNNFEQLKSSFYKEKELKLKELNKKLELTSFKMTQIIEKKNKNDYDSVLKNLNDKHELLLNTISTLVSKKSVCQSNIDNNLEALQILKDTPHCPTCKTPTNNPLIKEYIVELNAKVDVLNNDLILYNEKLSKADHLKHKIISKKSDLQNILTSLNKEIDFLQNEKTSIQNEISKEENKKFELDNIMSDSDIQKYIDQYNKSEESYNKSLFELNYSTVTRKILGDDGIRKYVISKVVPFFNNKVNVYLKMLGSEFIINFNETLNEKLLNRNGDEQLYVTLSSGEKKRIDISILLTLMDISNLQNSVDTNILILDEVLDTAMDDDGVSLFLNYLKKGFSDNYPDKCVYVITHRNTISNDTYDRLVKLIKVSGFTSVEKIIEMN